MASAVWLEKTWTASDGRKVRAGTGVRSRERIDRLKADGFKSGAPYYIVWREPGTTRKSYQSFKSLDDARAFKTQKERDLQTGTSVPKADRKQVLGAFADRVLAESYDLAPSTADWYRDHFERHVRPKLGHLPLEDITPARLREFFAKLVESSGNGTVTAVRRVLVKVLNVAVAEGIYAKGSPMRGIRTPKPSRREVKPLSVETVEALAVAIEPRYRLAVLVAGYAGLRGGEVGGLRVQDVDLRETTPTLTVVQAVRTVRARPELAGPKTEAARRRVNIPRFLVDEIEQHVTEFGVAEDGRLFESPRGGLVSHSTLDKALGKAAEKLGIPKPRFHDLRHTCAALLIQQGAHPKMIQQQLGHSSITTTLDVYGSLFPSLGEELARNLDAMRTRVLVGAKKPPELVGEVVEGE
jgi:integrase